MSRIKFKILATNGTWVKELIYFTQHSKGDIYYGEVNVYEPNKVSRHVSGVSHQKKGNLQTKLGRGRRLSDFVGLHQLFVFSIGKLVFEQPSFGREYFKEVKGNILIDIRKFEMRVGIMAFFLEPNKEDALNGLAEKLLDVEYTIYKATSPWIVIAIFDNGVPVINGALTSVNWDKTLFKADLPSADEEGQFLFVEMPATK
jgi:hypothetical protein